MFGDKYELDINLNYSIPKRTLLHYSAFWAQIHQGVRVVRELQSHKMLKPISQVHPKGPVFRFSQNSVYGSSRGRNQLCRIFSDQLKGFDYTGRSKFASSF